MADDQPPQKADSFTQRFTGSAEVPPWEADVEPRQAMAERFGGMQAPARGLTDEEVMRPATEGLYGDEIEAARESLMRQLTRSVAPSLGAAAPEDKEAMYRWTMEVYRRMDVLEKSGRNAFDVFDQQSPDYMGSQDAVSRFRPPLHQQIKDNGGVGSVQPGSDFLTALKVQTVGFIKSPLGGIALLGAPVTARRTAANAVRYLINAPSHSSPTGGGRVADEPSGGE